MEKIKRNN